ncbi:MAG: hypothetical protein HYT94_03695 [Parcubacteria group bacterium]|nr:hypothetical protein [Parcubacteria group bacterium]
MENFLPPPSPQEDMSVFINVSPAEFILKRDLLAPSLFAFLTPHTEDYYINNNTKLFLSKDLTSGFGINPDGELVSVFSLEKSRGEILVKKAVEEGATHLSCMGDKLLELYASFGFSPTEVIKWDDTLAPNNWDYERFGVPNIYQMSLIKQ